jgi:hypothetical protein
MGGGGMKRTTQALRLKAEIASEVPKTAMVLAAGLGKRMRPLTASRPKPLIEVAGQSLLDHLLERLSAAGVENVVVNVHYLADAVEAHLAKNTHGLSVQISDERSLLLETGGGMVKAAPLISTATICGSTARPTRSSCSLRIGTEPRWTRCCFSCRMRGRQTTAVAAISTWTAQGVFADG